jgi:hypothetical protein
MRARWGCRRRWTALAGCAGSVTPTGLDDRAGLVDALVERIEAVCELITGQAAEGDPAFQRHLAEGHVASYRRDLDFIESVRRLLEHALES